MFHRPLMVALIALVSFAGPLPAEQEKSSDTSAGANARVEIHRDLQYAAPGGHPQRLDLYVPASSEKADRPRLLVWVHGGGWRGGDKRGCPLRWLTGEGYAVASINYRLTDVAPFPAQIHDCKAAIRWLRAKAGEYGYDAERIGVAGGSAGGHLVALLGTSGGVERLEGEVGSHPDPSSEVQAVVDLFGPSDLTRFINDKPQLNRPGGLLYALFGGPPKDHEELARLASPVAFVDAGDAPLLILHGTEDRLVPLDQSRLLHEAYQEAGLASELIVIEGAGHGGPGFFTPEHIEAIRSFFARHIKNASGDPQPE